MVESLLHRAARFGSLSRRRGGFAWIAFAALLLLAPHVFSSDTALTLLCEIGTAMMLALSFNLLLGQAGMLSFCHATYAGFGAYAAVAALDAIGHGAWLPVTLVPLAGGLAGVLAGVVLGYITTRRSGTAFAMITLGVAELVWVGATMLPAWFGGERGLTTDRMVGPALWGITYGPQIQVYYLVAGWLFVCALAMYGLTRTPLGYLARAVRDNAERVAFIGHDPAAVRYAVQIIAGGFAGIAGGLAALNFEIVSAEHFSLARSGAVLLFTVLGGVSSFAGPMLGAVFGVLATTVLSACTRAWELYLGALFLAVVILRRMGWPVCAAAFGTPDGNRTCVRYGHVGRWQGSLCCCARWAPSH